MKHLPLLPIPLVVALALSGCGDKPAAETTAPVVRGEPIQSVAAKTSPPLSNAPMAAVPSNTTTVAMTPPGNDYGLLGFDKLAGYAIEVSDDLLGPVTNDVATVTAKTDALIPEAVRAFHRKKVSLKGFMLPLKVEGGLVTELLIMKDQSMCCYGSTPKLNEWVSIKMTTKGVKALMDQPVTLYGTMHIGEMRENGYLTGIYSMDGERMDAVEEN